MQILIALDSYLLSFLSAKFKHKGQDDSIHTEKHYSRADRLIFDFF